MPDREKVTQEPGRRILQNHLANEESRYLREHAHNPVDWYPWGNEAFDLAEKSDRPVFLSIGYMSCHWCHVMAKESYEDVEVARLLNNAFVCIKVDREERPDIDRLYMAACQCMTGTGGWPLHIVMTPGKKPFFAGTYIPKETRSGMVGLLDLIPRIIALWNERRDELLDEAGNVIASLQRTVVQTTGTELGLHTLDSGFRAFKQSFDRIRGGFGAAPKFPMLHQIMFLLRYWHRTANSLAMDMARGTLDSMARGGIRDHLGGGFHRYSTDPEWQVPHFEKMLYDQALAVMAYSEAYQVTGNEVYSKTARECAEFVIREMTSTGGGFFSSIDADSEGEEGKFYLWTTAKIREVLAPSEADLFFQVYQLTPVTNNPSMESGPEDITGVLSMTASPEEIASKLNIPVVDIRQSIEDSIKALRDARDLRIHPVLDDKILTDWNGLMIAALSKASSTLGEPRYLIDAKKAADFVILKMWSPERGLLHRSGKDRTGIPALADDYASIIWGLTELYFASFESKYLVAAIEMAANLHEYFWDRLEGGYFTVRAEADDIIISQKEAYDGALPSPNAMMMYNCERLALITGNQEYEQIASAIARQFSREITGCPSAFSFFLIALDLARGPATRVVISGKHRSPDTRAMMDAVRSAFLPSVVVLYRQGDETEPDILKVAPDTRSLCMIDDKSTAYVCIGRTCSLPITNTKELREKLGVSQFRSRKDQVSDKGQ